MECFAHAGATAVGVCRCGKAVCRGCAQDLGHALACSDACAAIAAEMELLNQRAKRTLAAAERRNKTNFFFIFLAAFGIFFIAFGIYAWTIPNDVAGFTGGAGVVMLALSWIARAQTRHGNQD
jgi:hypothetical protein